ncbi:hypothetical protein SPV_2507 [Streptococcus pneumoniae]|nr:hypothetical protein SPV_2507 [Streptococcus pneumoniae]
MVGIYYEEFSYQYFVTL